jgi:hypothetical protein
MAIEYVRSSSDAEARERARATVRASAERGDLPSEWYRAEDLQWSFQNFEDELAELERVALDARERQVEARAERARRHELHRATEAVLREWDEQDRAQRWKCAEIEAKSRLAAEEDPA